jgi:outer membrane protein TolC
VRSRLLDFYGGQRELSLLQAEVEARSAIVSMLERRFAAGMLSGPELSNERIRLADARRTLERQKAFVEETRVALAASTGLPVEQFNALRLSFSELDLIPGVPDIKGARSLALTNRIDVRRALLAYGMAEAALKLEVANQYPDFSLAPGYRWDQGDIVWSLGFALLLPVLNRNQGPILEAKARRELEAQNFTSLQARVIVDTQAAVIRLQSALSELQVAGELRDAAEGRNLQAERRFELGHADRLERVASTLELMTARRIHDSALLRALAAQGQLEDTLQIPQRRQP